MTEANRSITLDHDISIGGTVAVQAGTRVEIRKPNSGELRGTTLMALAQLDYGALEVLLPRITTPALSKTHIGAMDPADLMQAGGEVMDFLLPTAAKQAGSPTE